MSATTEQVTRLRRYIAESTTEVYSDGDLEDYIERYPLVDMQGRQPYVRGYTWPPTMQLNPYWMPTYDLHRAAAEVWGEKAAALAVLFDFSADGGQYSRKQQYDNALTMQRFHTARRSPRVIIQVPYSSDRLYPQYPANAPTDEELY